MATYAEGATVERRYPGPDADTARSAAEPQIAAFLEAGFVIAGESWIDDSAGTGTPVGDAIASGPLTYLAGRGGSLAIVYRATRPADLPLSMPAYTLTDPRQASLLAWSQLRIALTVIGVVLFLVVFVAIVSQVMSGTTQPAYPPFAP